MTARDGNDRHDASIAATEVPGSVDVLNALQWPAMVITVAATGFVASPRKRRRNVGFWLFLASNVAWVVWGMHADAHALVALQICLAAMNIRGAIKAAPDAATPSD